MSGKNGETLNCAEGSRSRGVLTPSSPSSRPPTTGTRSHESNTPMRRRDSEAISKSAASCATFAADTTGCLANGVSAPRLLERQRGNDTDDDQRLTVQIEGNDWMIE